MPEMKIIRNWVEIRMMDGFSFCLRTSFVNVEVLFSQHRDFYKNKSSPLILG